MSFVFFFWQSIKKEYFPIIMYKKGFFIKVFLWKLCFQFEIINKTFCFLCTGSRFHTTHDFGFITLDITATVPEDSGVYTCKAINAAGEAVSSTSLKIKRKDFKLNLIFFFFYKTVHQPSVQLMKMVLFTLRIFEKMYFILFLYLHLQLLVRYSLTYISLNSII
jgi:hypothetical protein